MNVCFPFEEMMVMNKWQVSLGVVFAVLLMAWADAPASDVHLTADQMKVALRTATVEENGFIQSVLDAVDLGVLPEELVQSTFLWARKKPKHKFQYFKYGIILRAAEIGVTLKG
jgi:hypothetical protein